MSPKIGYLVPGTKIPISSDDELFRNKNSYKIIINFAWHISKEIKLYLLSNKINAKIINIIETAIGNSPNFFSEPLSPLNPYNNQEFTISTLYNIYFQMLKIKNVFKCLQIKYFPHAVDKNGRIRTRKMFFFHILFDRGEN